MIGGQELIIILLIVLVLFGAKKIPDLMRGLGRGVKEFKDGMNGTNVDPESKPKTETSDKKE
ncbi:MAG: twin-arginine translocase TatA/TatE family subunit [Bacteroidales bacterium]|nr:twin-arginine translocase TatA/TatE family subunit [Bacteroidales bacterium]